jgi:hypothetical protein
VLTTLDLFPAFQDKFGSLPNAGAPAVRGKLFLTLPNGQLAHPLNVTIDRTKDNPATLEVTATSEFTAPGTKSDLEARLTYQNQSGQPDEIKFCLPVKPRRRGHGRGGHQGHGHPGFGHGAGGGGAGGGGAGGGLIGF